MRKVRISLAMVVCLMLATIGYAQDDTTLNFDEWVVGDITADDYLHQYRFTGGIGDIVLIEAYVEYERSELDAELDLLDPESRLLATNDDFVFTFGYVGAVIVAELPLDGDYTVVVTRFNREAGTSTGSYRLRVRKPKLLMPGAEREVTIYAANEADLPALYVLRPETEATWTININHLGGELYPSVLLRQWSGQVSGDVPLLWLRETYGMRSASLVVSLEADRFYVLSVNKGLAAEPAQSEVQVRLGIE